MTSIVSSLIYLLNAFSMYSKNWLSFYSLHEADYTPINIYSNFLFDILENYAFTKSSQRNFFNVFLAMAYATFSLFSLALLSKMSKFFST